MIRFLLDAGDGRIEEIALGDEVPADLTVLDWLRLHRRLSGTKEGCGSGDCGACTVVVASPVDGADGAALHHESVNACIAFVGALHGRLLVTVESLARGDTLHPVQQAMVDEHGSQCGFCTPGFVMSLYALYRAPDAPRVTYRGGSRAGVVERASRAAEGVGTPARADGRDVPAGASEDPRPLDLDVPTPVAAYRSAANAAAVSVTPGTASSVRERAGERADGHAGGQAADGRVDGRAGEPTSGLAREHADESAPHTRSLPMSTGWLDGLSTDDGDGLSHRIDRVLGGNLCRCTGYRPIKRAAAVALAARESDRDAEKVVRERERERAVAVRLTRLAAIRPGHAGFHAPDSLDEFAALVERHPDAPLLGGGTDLALEVTQKLRDLPRLIHVARVPELARVEAAGRELTIGAAVSLTRCMALLGAQVPGAAELLLRFGSDPVRNRGTIGGNIASASPIGDLPPLLLALGATLVLQQGGHVRELSLDDFFTGYRETRLERGEFVRAVRVTLPGSSDGSSPGAIGGSPDRSPDGSPVGSAHGSPAGSSGGPRELCAVYKVSKRMEDDISAVCGAFRLTFDESGDEASGRVPAESREGACSGRRIVAARLAFGGMAATPARARRAEAVLEGARFERATVEAAGAALDEDFRPLSDARASAGYRSRVARNLLLRLWLEADAPPTPVRLSLGTSVVPARGARRASGGDGTGVGSIHGER